MEPELRTPLVSLLLLRLLENIRDLAHGTDLRYNSVSELTDGVRADSVR
jgi:hypothetical protein